MATKAISRNGEKYVHVDDIIVVDGVSYAREGGAEVDDDMSCDQSPTTSGYCIVRTRSAGVFAGTLVWRVGDECCLDNGRRLWRWEGAASLSQLATDGTSLPLKCKFPCEVARVVLLGVIEILDVTPAAQDSIRKVPIWSA